MVDVLTMRRVASQSISSALGNRVFLPGVNTTKSSSSGAMIGREDGRGGTSVADNNVVVLVVVVLLLLLLLSSLVIPTTPTPPLVPIFFSSPCTGSSNDRNKQVIIDRIHTMTMYRLIVKGKEGVGGDGWGGGGVEE
jgi:hypothetical protein